MAHPAVVVTRETFGQRATARPRKNVVNVCAADSALGILRFAQNDRLHEFFSTPISIVVTIEPMSPTIFREGPYRFYFFSREETRIHVHVASGDGEAKFWLSPEIELAEVQGLPEREIGKLVRIIRNHEQQIRAAWSTHFGG